MLVLKLYRVSKRGHNHRRAAVGATARMDSLIFRTFTQAVTYGSAKVHRVL